MTRSYGQFCGLARALDHVGDRWTLLLVRELLLGDASYGELLDALPGIPTNLLAERLRALQHDGLVTRARDAGDRRRSVYALTPLGRGLEQVVLELIRWGAAWMGTGAGGDRFDPRWLRLALRAVLRDRPLSGDVLVETAGEQLCVRRHDTGLRVEQCSHPEGHPTRIEGAPEAVLGLLAGLMTLSQASGAGVRVTGGTAALDVLAAPGAAPAAASPGRRADVP